MRNRRPLIVLVAAMVATSAQAQRGAQPFAIPRLDPRPPLPRAAPPADVTGEPQPVLEERDPAEEALRRRPRRPAVGAQAVPPTSCLEAAAFPERIEEPVTSSGNYELWSSLAPPPERPRQRR